MNLYGFNFDETISGLVGVMAVGLASGYLLFLLRLILFTWIERKEG